MNFVDRGVVLLKHCYGYVKGCSSIAGELLLSGTAGTGVLSRSRSSCKIFCYFALRVTDAMGGIPNS